MKKIIAFSLAVVFVISLFAVSFSVSASDEPIITNQEYYAAQSYLIAKYKDGDISYSEFQQQSQAVTDEFINNNTVGGELHAGALNASNTVAAVSKKIGNTVQKYGDAARDYISEYTSDFFNGYTVLSDKPTTDLQGGVAMLKTKNADGYYSIYYGNTSGEVYYSGNAKMLYLKTYRTEYYNPDGTMYYSENNNSSIGCQYYSDSTFLYGSWKLRADGSEAPTDDEFETVSDYDFSQVPERELEELLKKLLNEMELKEPDLSTLEGLLNAIYSRLGTLDSDNDNALLSSINSSIKSLSSSISEFSSSIETAINDLKDTVSSLFSDKDDDTDNDTEKHEIAGTLYNVIPVEKNWLQKITHNKTNLLVEYQGKQYYLESDGTLKLDDKYYNVDMNYASTLDEILYTLLDIRDSLDLLTEEERKMDFNEFFDLKLNDLKMDFDENFCFKDNLKNFLSNIFDEFENAVPKYENGDKSDNNTSYGDSEHDGVASDGNIDNESNKSD